MDPEHPVVKLCAAGMQAEAAGRPAAAAALFLEAWESRTDAYGACVAAHYVARHQETAEQTLAWNQRALDEAAAVEEDRVASFYPSLYLNLGHSHEVMGDADTARRLYRLAAERMDALPADDPYARLVRRGIEEGCRRVGESTPDAASLPDSSP